MEERTPKILHPHNRKTRKEKTDKDRHSPTKQLLTSTVVYGPNWREHRSRRERVDIGAVVLEGKPRVVVLVVLGLGFRRAFVRSVVMLVLWCSSGRGWW
jgi:hypothetical protein